MQIVSPKYIVREHGYLFTAVRLVGEVKRWNLKQNQTA
jgi:hypothetical protein